jgi:hypothetical protein
VATREVDRPATRLVAASPVTRPGSSQICPPNRGNSTLRSRKPELPSGADQRGSTAKGAECASIRGGSEGDESVRRRSRRTESGASMATPGVPRRRARVACEVARGRLARGPRPPAAAGASSRSSPDRECSRASAPARETNSRPRLRCSMRSVRGNVQRTSLPHSGALVLCSALKSASGVDTLTSRAKCSAVGRYST